MSSASDRVQLVDAARRAAASRQAADLKAATSDDQANAILRNVQALETAYLEATIAALNATGPDVEAAYRDAQAATAAVEKAYADAAALADKIRSVAGVVTAVGTLVKKASGG
jgi:hypothetical protein